MAWPEKIVGFILVCGALMIAWFMATSPTVGSTAQVGALVVSLPRIIFGAVIFLGPLWIVLRMLDLMFAGPARRKDHITARFSP